MCKSRGDVPTSKASSLTTVVVLPVPGPPVMSVMRFCAATSQAKRCRSGSAPLGAMVVSVLLVFVGGNKTSRRGCKSAGTSQGAANRWLMRWRIACSAAHARRKYRRSPWELLPCWLSGPWSASCTSTKGLASPCAQGKVAAASRRSAGRRATCSSLQPSSAPASEDRLAKSKQAWPRPHWWLVSAASHRWRGSSLGSLLCSRLARDWSKPVRGAVCAQDDCNSEESVGVVDMQSGTA